MRRDETVTFLDRMGPDMAHQKVGERSFVTRKEKKSSFPPERSRIAGFWPDWVFEKN